jgi:hypothetical protein
MCVIFETDKDWSGILNEFDYFDLGREERKR